MTDPLQSDGQFELIRRIAVGGMGEVLLARYQGSVVHGVTPGIVVLKRTLIDHPNRDHQNRLLREEARIALRLRHENLVETFLLTEVGNDPVLVMEYLAGRSMAQVLGAAKRTKQMVPIDVALRVVHQAACGLHFAHTLTDGQSNVGLVHRDISPANIFVTFDGRVKVIDFGVAKADDSEIRTSTGVLKGKLGYMAPEHAIGDPLDARADLWSLGVLLWETLVADRLFSNANPAVTLHQITHAEITLPSHRRPDVPAEVDALVMALLTRDVRARISSAAALVAEIEALSSSGWSDADLGAFLTERFPADAARAEDEVRQRAQTRGQPIPKGLISGRAMVADPDLEAATVVQQRDDLLAYVRETSGPVPTAVEFDGVDDEEEAKTALLSAGEVDAILATDGPTPHETGDDSAPTRVLVTGTPGTSSAARPASTREDSAENLIFEADDAGLPDDPTVIDTASDDVKAGGRLPAKAQARVSSDPPPPSGARAPTARSGASFPREPSNETSRTPSQTERLNRPRARRRHRHRPGSAAVALLTFGALASVMGLAFAFLLAIREPVVTYVAYPDDDGTDIICARGDAPAGKPLQTIDPVRPALILKKGEMTAVDPARFLAALDDQGVTARARLPQTLRDRIAAALPLVILILALMAVAYSWPAYLIRRRNARRALALGGCIAVAAVGAVLLINGFLAWPGLATLHAQGPKLRAKIFLDPGVPAGRPAPQKTAPPPTK